MGLVEITMVTLVNMYVWGPLPRPHLTDFWSNRRQESVPFVSKVHLSSLSRTDTTIRSNRPALTNFCSNRRQQSVPFVSKVHPGRPSRPDPTAALTDFWNNRRDESVPFVSKVHLSSPSRPSVHGPLWRISQTIGARNPCRFFSKVHPDGPSQMSVTARSHEPLKQTAPHTASHGYNSVYIPLTVPDRFSDGLQSVGNVLSKILWYSRFSI